MGVDFLLRGFCPFYPVISVWLYFSIGVYIPLLGPPPYLMGPDACLLSCFLFQILIDILRRLLKFS